MKFRFIAAEKAHHSLTHLCLCLRVTRSGFYAWQRRPESAHAQRDRRLKVLIRASFKSSKHRYGSPRIHRDLIEQEERVSRKRVIRLMQEPERPSLAVTQERGEIAASPHDSLNQDVLALESIQHDVPADRKRADARAQIVSSTPHARIR